ncbi:nuclear transcription factor Y subunit A-2-like [Bidens hawaiensis]|uniref:nuclear transcription factor Y subunit A-2-like n=1 Tax=Bidens hawaiensis TaxID=980011 RepID=UPI00404A9E00
MDSGYYKQRHDGGPASDPDTGSGQWLTQPGFEDSVGGLNKNNIGESKSLSSAEKPVQPQAAFTLQPAPQMLGSHLELGFGRPALVCGAYPYGDQYYGVLSAYGPQTV